MMVENAMDFRNGVVRLCYNKDYVRMNTVLRVGTYDRLRFLLQSSFTQSSHKNLPIIIIPHATSCGGYNVFDPSVSQSVSQSVRQSCFSCQPNSSETAQQNFVKLCSYEGHNVQMRISTGNFDSIFFLGVTPFLNLEIWPK